MKSNVLELFASSARLIKTKAALVAVVAMALVGSFSASATVTLPDTGADISGLVTAGITALGAIVAVIVGGYFAFLVIKKAMSWARRMA